MSSRRKAKVARKRARQRRINAARSIVSLSKPRLSPCAENYAKAIVNPWNGHPNTCVPYRPKPSTTYTFKIRGYGNIGTQGFGYVALEPDNPSFDGTALRYTTSTYGSGMSHAGFWNVSPDTIQASWAMSPYGVTDLGPNTNLSFRRIGVALKVHYEGPMLTRQGSMILYEHPGGSQNLLEGGTAVNPITTDQFLANQQAREVPIGGKEHYIYVTPRDDELEYLNDVSYVHRIAVLFSGANPGDQFYFEACAMYEIAGDLSTNPRQRESDATGVSAVLAAAGQTMKTAATPKEHETVVKQRAIKNLDKAVSGLGSHSLPQLTYYPNE